MLFFSLNLLVLLCGLALAGLGVWLVAEEHFYLGTGNTIIKTLFFLLIIIIIVDFIIAIENENQSSNEHLLISEQVWSLANLLLSSLSMYGPPPTTWLPSYHHHQYLLRCTKNPKVVAKCTQCSATESTSSQWKGSLTANNNRILSSRRDIFTVT